MFKKRRELKQRQAELSRLDSELREIRYSLGDAWQIFNSTTDPELTEACIYEINALRARYDHSIKGARSFFL